MRRAQSWTVDYTLGLLFFLAALGVTSSMIADTLETREFDNLLRDANRLSEALVSEGYPSDWDATDVIRGGLLYDGRLSWRKLGLLQELSEAELREVFPSGYNYAFTFTNNSGAIIGYGDTCSFGNAAFSDTPFPESTSPGGANVSIAYYGRTDGPDDLESWATTRGATVYQDDQVVTLLRDVHLYGLVIFEDPLFNNTLNTTMTATLLREEFRKAAEYGATIVLTGMLGTPVLGVNTTNVSDPNGTVALHNEPYFLLNESDAVNFTTAYDLEYMPVSGGLLGNLDGATHEQTLISNGARLAAAWQYEDSRAYYFSDTQGDYGGDPVLNVIRDGLTRASKRSEVDCDVQPELIEADDLVRIDRLVADRGEIYSLTLYMWRNP